MITLNSTILSYNKVKEIDEYKPMLPPESITLIDEKNNHSFQKFIPNIYDLDEIDFNKKIVPSNSSPNIKEHNDLKNKFLNSIMIQGNEKERGKDLGQNIYCNSTENYKKAKNIIYTEEESFGKEEFRNNNIYQNEINIIDNNIKNNIENKTINIYKKAKDKSNIIRNNTNNNKKKKEYEDLRTEISNYNINININSELLNSQQTLKDLNDRKSIKSAIIPSFNNIMRKDPTSENSIIINTSLYKRKRRKKNIINDISKENEISRNSLNSYLKFEEESKEHQLTIEKKNNKKEEDLNPLISSKNGNKNNLKQININPNNNSNSNVDENENYNDNDEIKSIKLNNLNDYTFRTGKNSINNNILNNPKLNHLNYNNKININDIKNNKNLLNNNFNTNKEKSKIDFDFKENNEKNLTNNNIINEDNNNIEESKNKNKNENEKEIKKESNVPIVHLKFNNLKKILNNDGLFNVLTFLDCYDLMCLLKTNKSLIFLINRAISNAYYFKIKENLSQFISDFQLLKCSLVYTKVKDSFKIDFETKILFTKQKNTNNLNDDNEKKISPRCYQIIYFYNYFKSINPQIKLKTKENTKKIKMYDYYTFDLYSEYDNNFPDIFINKEQSLFDINASDKLAYIQPILPFKINDKGILDLEIYSSNYDFINPSSIKIVSKCYDLKKYINNLKQKGNNNLRICEYENICFHWKIMTNEKRNQDKTFFSLINKVEKKFKPYFDIQNILYENIGFFIFKIYLVAVKKGRIGNKQSEDDFGFNITIKEKGDYVENEIKKNNLLLDRREIYELRLGETLILYFSEKPKKTKSIPNKKK